MPNSTVRADARTLPETEPPQPAVTANEVQALAAAFEAAWKAEDDIPEDYEDEKADAAIARTRAVAEKILAFRGSDISIMGLKARVYLWSLAATPELIAETAGGKTAGEALISLFRDLGADYAIGGSPALSALDREVLDLWHRDQQMRAALEDKSVENTDADDEAYCAIQAEIDGHIEDSVLALGAILIEAIRGDYDDEHVPGLYCAALAAIRPQLVGAIAEDADRVLADTESDPALALVAKLDEAWTHLGEVIEETEEGEGGRVDEAHRAIDDALEEIQKTPPTTLAGARAAIAWLVNYDKDNIPEESGKYLRTLSRSPVFALSAVLDVTHVAEGRSQ